MTFAHQNPRLKCYCHILDLGFITDIYPRSSVMLLLLGRRCVGRASLLPLGRNSPCSILLPDGNCSSRVKGSRAAAAPATTPTCARHKTDGGVPQAKRKYEPGANKYQVNNMLHGAVRYGRYIVSVYSDCTETKALQSLEVLYLNRGAEKQPCSLVWRGSCIPDSTVLVVAYWCTTVHEL